MKIKDTFSLEQSYDKPRQHIKKQRHYCADKGPSSQSYGFSSSHVWMWEMDCKESWVLNSWYFWTVVLKTLESSLDCKEIQPVHPKGNQSWLFIGSIDAETPILWPPDAKHWLIGKTLILGKVEGRRRRGQQRTGWLDGITDSMDMSLSKLPEMVKDGEACCSPWGHKESAMTEQLSNNSNLKYLELLWKGDKVLRNASFLSLLKPYFSSFYRIIHLNLKNVGMNLSNTSENCGIKPVSHKGIWGVFRRHWFGILP